jgi:hypothetical protein
MTGREVITTRRSFTPEALFAFMDARWDRENYSDFRLGSPTDPDSKLYVLLPATSRHVVIVYSRPAGKFLNKDNIVVLSVAETGSLMSEALARSNPASGNIIAGIVKIGNVISQEKDRRGQAQEALLAYADHMRTILGEAGYLK